MKEGSNAIVDDGNDKWNGERQKNYTKKNVRVTEEIITLKKNERW